MRAAIPGECGSPVEACAMPSDRAARILVVDDDPASVEVLRECLEAEGYEVETAADGEGALKTVLAIPPDLVLLDVAMPRMDGFEVCQRLRAEAATASVPILFVTALDADEDKEKAVQAGGDDFVTKPVVLVEVVARVKSLLRVRDLTCDLERALGYIRELERRGKSGTA